MENLSFVLLLAAGAAILFVPLALYYAFPEKRRPAILLVLSILIYAVQDWRWLFFLLATALTTFFAARLLHRVRRKKLLVGGTIALNAAIWFAIKQLPWMTDLGFRLLWDLGYNGPAVAFSFLVPMGISYYTLQAIGYLADVSSGRIEAERNFARYLLFLAWFPAILQGPISRYSQLMPQLCKPEKFSVERMRRALFLMLIGAVKKYVVANRLGIVVDSCFAGIYTLSGAELYLGAIAYSFQLYFDFSACVDICRGLSSLFGVELIHNFDRPYLATSIKDFWGRWHMSLSSWLKDYIYIPLGGSRKGKMRKYLNIAITFLVSGLWHGNGLNFFLWGLMHAVYQIVGDATLSLRRRIKNRLGVKEGSASERFFRRFITFHLVTLAWIEFRGVGLTTGLRYIYYMFTRFAPWTLVDGSLAELGVSAAFLVIVGLHIALFMLYEHRFARQEDAVERVMNTHLLLRWGIYLLLIFDVLLFGAYGSGYSAAGFMYGGF